MTPGDAASGPPGGERVRLCLQCGEMVAFDVRVCPACGHFEPAGPDPRGASRPCDACGGRVAAESVFCPRCGDETGLVPPPASALARRSGPARGGEPGVAASGDGLDDGASSGIEGALVALLALAGPVVLLAAVALLAAARGAPAA